MYGTCSVPLAYAEHVRLISVRSTSIVGWACGGSVSTEGSYDRSILTVKSPDNRRICLSGALNPPLSRMSLDASS